MKDKMFLMLVLVMMNWSLIGCALDIDPELEDSRGTSQELGFKLSSSSSGSSDGSSLFQESSLQSEPISEKHLNQHFGLFQKIAKINKGHERLTQRIKNVESPTDEEVEAIEKLNAEISSLRSEIVEIQDGLEETNEEDQIFSDHLYEIDNNLDKISSHWEDIAGNYQSSIKQAVDIAAATATAAGFFIPGIGWIVSAAGIAVTGLSSMFW